MAVATSAYEGLANAAFTGSVQQMDQPQLCVSQTTFGSYMGGAVAPCQEVVIPNL